MCVFLYIILDLLNIGNQSKTLAFKNSKRLLYKYYPKFVKPFKKHPNKFDRIQFLVFLNDCIPNTKSHRSIGKLLTNVNVLQVETGKNTTNPLYSETNKQTNKNEPKEYTNNKKRTCFSRFL